MMSIETIIIKHIKSDICYKDNCVHKSMLNINSDIPKVNSQKLESIVEKILTKFKDLSIDRKLTFNPSLLAGITIDWRHIDDWDLIKKEVEPYILKTVNHEINNNKSEYSLYIQRYSTHPFIDIYSTLCSKEIAYDNIWKIINEPSIDREGNNKKSFT